MRVRSNIGTKNCIFMIHFEEKADIDILQAMKFDVYQNSSLFRR